MEGGGGGGGERGDRVGIDLDSVSTKFDDISKFNWKFMRSHAHCACELAQVRRMPEVMMNDYSESGAS